MEEKYKQKRNYISNGKYRNKFSLNSALQKTYLKDNTTEYIQNCIRNSIVQKRIFNHDQCIEIENKIEKLIEDAENGLLKESTIDKTPLRTKYFFGERYTYGSQLVYSNKDIERLYPRGFVDTIPEWIQSMVVDPLVSAKIISKDYINSVVINDYQPNGCIVSHIDPVHLFDRPIISVTFMSDSMLSFGCKFRFRPLKVSKPILKIPLKRGYATVLSDYAANSVTHCVRPEDTPFRRSVIILRRVWPWAERLGINDIKIINLEFDNSVPSKGQTKVENHESKVLTNKKTEKVFKFELKNDLKTHSIYFLNNRKFLYKPYYLHVNSKDEQKVLQNDRKRSCDESDKYYKRLKLNRKV